jgi:DUF438 domain-containing protein
MENRTKRIPDKRNLEHLGLFPNDKLEGMEHDISNIMQKIDLFENELKKDDKPISDIKQRIDLMCDVFKTVGSFKTFPKRNPHQHVLRTTKEEKDEEPKQVEEIKMLSDIPNDPLLNLEKCSLHELLAMLHKYANDSTINMHQAGFGS